jgi:Multicopper oxidase
LAAHGKWTFRALRLAAFAIVMAVAACQRSGADAPPQTAPSGKTEVQANDNRRTAGSIRDGVLRLALEVREGADSQLTGALIVDPIDGAADDRVFVIGLLPAGPGVSMWVINGRSWPDTERFTHRLGDRIRWRWINATGHRHRMHLHGHYFRVASSGDNARDVSRPSDATGAKGDNQTISVISVFSVWATSSATWRALRDAAGLHGLRFHDLRTRGRLTHHTGLCPKRT